ncbi:DUF7564 family protein [Natronolimnohabitans innermongolicus]
MTNREYSLCINCGTDYERENAYHGYYCVNCRPGPGERHGADGYRSH